MNLNLEKTQNTQRILMYIVIEWQTNYKIEQIPVALRTCAVSTAANMVRTTPKATKHPLLE